MNWIDGPRCMRKCKQEEKGKTRKNLSVDVGSAKII